MTDIYLKYGTTTDYGSTKNLESRSNSVSVALNDLQPNTTYHFSYGFTDGNGDSYSSPDLTFTTLAQAYDITSTFISRGSYVLSWKTVTPMLCSSGNSASQYGEKTKGTNHVSAFIAKGRIDSLYGKGPAQTETFTVMCTQEDSLEQAEAMTNLGSISYSVPSYDAEAEFNRMIDLGTCCVDENTWKFNKNLDCQTWTEVYDANGLEYVAPYSKNYTNINQYTYTPEYQKSVSKSVSVELFCKESGSQYYTNMGLANLGCSFNSCSSQITPSEPAPTPVVSSPTSVATKLVKSSETKVTSSVKEYPSPKIDGNYIAYLSDNQTTKESSLNIYDIRQKKIVKIFTESDLINQSLTGSKVGDFGCFDVNGSDVWFFYQTKGEGEEYDKRVYIYNADSGSLTTKYKADGQGVFSPYGCGFDFAGDKVVYSAGFIQQLDLSTKGIKQLMGRQVYFLAVDNGKLYYNDSTGVESVFKTYDLVTGISSAIDLSYLEKFAGKNNGSNYAFVSVKNGGLIFRVDSQGEPAYYLYNLSTKAVNLLPELTGNVWDFDFTAYRALTMLGLDTVNAELYFSNFGTVNSTPSSSNTNTAGSTPSSSSFTSTWSDAEKALVKKIDSSLTSRLKGNILLQVQEHGEAWYVDPNSLKKYYMKDGATAYQMLRKFGLGIKDSDLAKIPTEGDDSLGDQALVNRLRGRILLQVEQNGEAWYINPKDGKRYYLKNGDEAYKIMRFLSLGITNSDLRKIAVGEI
ncbi:MAG: fibronectin type III domain-containing protein [Candidatus Buchananbacteria bacterium]|nr:fibronectin type III domain-containing protein [Candidatus Buchananbacteria bacterium]